MLLQMPACRATPERCRAACALPWSCSSLLAGRYRAESACRAAATEAAGSLRALLRLYAVMELLLSGRRSRARRSNPNTGRSVLVPSVQEVLDKGHEEVSHEIAAFAQYHITPTTHMLCEATEHGTSDWQMRCTVGCMASVNKVLLAPAASQASPPWP